MSITICRNEGNSNHCMQDISLIFLGPRQSVLLPSTHSLHTIPPAAPMHGAPPMSSVPFGSRAQLSPIGLEVAPDLCLARVDACPDLPGFPFLGKHILLASAVLSSIHG